MYDINWNNNICLLIEMQNNRSNWRFTFLSIVIAFFVLKWRKDVFDYAILHFRDGVLLFVAAMLLIGLVVYFGHPYLIFIPQMPFGARTELFQPEKVGFKRNDVWITCRDGVKIHSWLFKHPNPKDHPTIIYFHGNAGNISYSLPIMKGFYDEADANVFIVEYHGYGLSGGSANETNMINDVEDALMHLIKNEDVNPEKIVLFGTSIGGAIVIQAARRLQDKIACIVIENTFTCIYDVAVRLFWIFHPIIYLYSRLLTTKLDTLSVISEIEIPILFISGRQDEILPVDMMDDLYSSCKSESKEMAKFQYGKHNETFLENGYNDAINNFLLKHLSTFKLEY